VRRGLALALILAPVLAAGPLAAEVTSSPRPQPNPAYLVAAPAIVPAPAAASGAGTPAEPVPGLRPKPRPKALETMVAAARDAVEKRDEPADLLSLRPKERPEDLELAAAAEPAAEPRAESRPKKKKKERATKKGSVCGVNAIKGEKIATIKSKVKGCGLADGVRVTSVSGVRLSQAITVDCATATALNTWVDKVVQPALRDDVVELKVAAHYICRSRNNQKGAKISEHGRGKAVDIAGFVLASGKVLSVLKDYNKTLRKVHKGACGIFGTTLGPGSDGYHEDHFHLDTAAYRKGAYCR
jgi:hypothetical protein